MFSLPRQPFASHRPGEAVGTAWARFDVGGAHVHRAGSSAGAAGIGEADDASVRSLGHTRDVVPPRVAQNPAPVLDVAGAGQAKKRSGQESARHRCHDTSSTWMSAIVEASDRRAGLIRTMIPG